MEQLKHGQKIIFTIKGKSYTYVIFSNFLCNRDLHPNDQIFEDLGLNKTKFCSDCYGYSPDDGDWPNSKDKDFAALTRVVEALFPYCDKVTLDGYIVYPLSEKSISTKPESFISSSNLESPIIDFESIVKSQTIKLVFI